MSLSFELSKREFIPYVLGRCSEALHGIIKTAEKSGNSRQVNRNVLRSLFLSRPNHKVDKSDRTDIYIYFLICTSFCLPT